ncbi:MAG: MaoC family dehydratase [Candidatus Binatia bacterium]|nr:MaoC family dehydratase [Candidatus Binatia bacterium]
MSAIEIGDEIGPLTRTLTLADVQRYAAVTSLTDERFLKAERATQMGFHRPIVPGPLTATLLAKLLTDSFPGWRLRNFQVSFRTPVGHGDTLAFWGTVTEKGERDGVATIHCDVVVENQHGDRVIVGTATLVPRPHAERTLS